MAHVQGLPGGSAARSRGTGLDGAAFPGRATAARDATFPGRATAARDATFPGRAAAARDATFPGRAAAERGPTLTGPCRIGHAPAGSDDHEGPEPQRENLPGSAPPLAPSSCASLLPHAGRISRRAFLGLLAGGALSLGPGRAFGIGERAKFRIGQLVTQGGVWNPRPTALRRLLWEVDKRTSVDVTLEPAQLRITDPGLFRHPFLYLAGARDFQQPGEAEVARLRRHLLFGGFLLLDSAEGRPGGAFDRSVRTLLGRLFPKTPLARLPDDHVVYKSFYLLDRPVGRIAAQPFLEAVIHDGRAVAIYCQNDLGGAFARDAYGQWEHDCFPGGEPQRERAFRLGVNLVMYALCLDYKSDQVHVPFILRRRSRGR